MIRNRRRDYRDYRCRVRDRIPQRLESVLFMAVRDFRKLFYPNGLAFLRGKSPQPYSLYSLYGLYTRYKSQTSSTLQASPVNPSISVTR